MGKLLIAGVLMAFCAAASAGETGVINQAGPYEATMRFYLHPAHGFPRESTDVAVAEATEKPAAHVNESDKTRQAVAQATSKKSGYQLRQVATRDVK